MSDGKVLRPYDSQALALMAHRLGEWIAANSETLALGGSKVQGDLEATGMLYSEACGYIRALNEVRERLIREVEAELRGE